MREPILDLSKQQTEAIQVAANLVRPEWRQRFLNSVQDALLRYDRRISDSEIAEAIVAVRGAFSEGVEDDW